jgi:predicted lipoprotein
MLSQIRQVKVNSLAGVGLALLVGLASSAGHAAPAEVADAGFAREVVEKIYQPGFERFSQTSGQFLAVVQSACQNPSPESLAELRARFGTMVSAFSAIELYRMGPLLVDNRQNRLFYWPDKRRVGERQLRELLADASAQHLTATDVSGKSVTLQGLPALERLLFGKSSQQHLAAASDTPDCQVVSAIAGNTHLMAMDINQSWQNESMMVQSMLHPEQGSEYFRSYDEVLRSLVTQIIVAIDVILDRKIAALMNEDGQIRQAPLWRSGQTLPMIRANLESVRALSVDSGLAGVGGLDNELAFEFRSADQMLHKLQALPALTNDQSQLTDDARSLLRSLTAVVGSIKYTLNDRFTAALGITAGFNSEDGD